MLSILILGWCIPSFFIGLLFFSGIQAKLLSMILLKIGLFRVQSQYLTQSTPLQGDQFAFMAQDSLVKNMMKDG